jgi:hypothetical protein
MQALLRPTKIPEEDQQFTLPAKKNATRSQIYFVQKRSNYYGVMEEWKSIGSKVAGFHQN